MLPLDLHAASVPVFLRYLSRLTALLDVAEVHVHRRGLEAGELLQARLAPDMLPFETQVRVAANFALRACLPLAGRTVPPEADVVASFEGLRVRIAEVTALLDALPSACFEATRTIDDQAGQALVSLPAPDFLWHYALPNFFFHMSAAYAILRHRGVAVGKVDFDGFHRYET